MSHRAHREQNALSRLVSEFAEAMRQKLWKKQREGRSGWQDTSDSKVPEILRERLYEHVEAYRRGDPKQLVDIANLAAMLWYHEAREAWMLSQDKY